MRVLGLVLLLILAGCAGLPAPEAETEGVDHLPVDHRPEEDGLADGTTSSQGEEGAILNKTTESDDARGTGANHTKDADDRQHGDQSGADGNQSDPDPRDPAGNQSDPDSGDPAGNQSDPDPGDPDQSDAEGNQPEHRLLEVSVFDYTSSFLARPRNTQIVAGAETWNPDLSYGSAGPQPMGHHVVDELQEEGLVVFPDGRDGARCAVDLRVTAEMVDESHDAVTQVEIYDAEVWIYGMAIPGHPDWDSPFVCDR